MNYAPLIFEESKKRKGFLEFILVAGAPVYIKQVNKLEKLSDKTLTLRDIQETLSSLKTRVAGSQKLAPNKGFFSFGIPDTGRFSVFYFLQRSSHVISISRASFGCLNLDEILENKDIYEKASKIVLEGNLICVLSQSKIAYSEFILSFLNYLGEKSSLLIYTAERPLTYLLRHNNSIFIQRELGTDVESLEEAIKDSFNVNPNILFINDVSLSGKELIENIFSFFPYPFTVIFNLVGNSKEDFEKTLKTFELEHIESHVNSLWILRYKEDKYQLEIIT